MRFLARIILMGLIVSLSVIVHVYASDRDTRLESIRDEREMYLNGLREKMKPREIQLDIEVLVLIEEEGADHSGVERFLREHGLEQYYDIIVEVGDRFGLDPKFITAVMVHESNFLRSKIAVDKNNLFGLNARDEAPYEYAYTFRSKEDSIVYFGSMIRDLYVDRGRCSVSEIGERYATDALWAHKVEKYMSLM